MGFGPLSEHLTGNDEIEIIGFHPVFGPAHHETLAVETRIEVGSVSVFRIEHDLLVRLDYINDVELDTNLFGSPQCVVALLFLAVLVSDRVGVPFHTESSEEIQSFNMDALLKHDTGRQHGIKAAGNQGNCFSFGIHGVVGGQKLEFAGSIVLV